MDRTAGSSPEGFPCRTSRRFAEARTRCGASTSHCGTSSGICSSDPDTSDIFSTRRRGSREQFHTIRLLARKVRICTRTRRKTGCRNEELYKGKGDSRQLVASRLFGDHAPLWRSVRCYPRNLWRCSRLHPCGGRNCCGGRDDQRWSAHAFSLDLDERVAGRLEDSSRLLYCPPRYGA